MIELKYTLSMKIGHPSCVVCMQRLTYTLTLKIGQPIAGYATIEQHFFLQIGHPNFVCNDRATL